MTRFALGLMVLIASSANASNYPSNYCDQHVTALNQGPMLFASIDNGGCGGGGMVIGYKNRGILAQRGAHGVDAVVTASCRLYDGSTASRETVVKLGREYHGTGFMSAEFNKDNLVPQNCSDWRSIVIAVAFSDGRGNWDSQYGANYRFTAGDFERFGKRVSTRQNGYNGKANFRAWELIVNEMRN